MRGKGDIRPARGNGPLAGPRLNGGRPGQRDEAWLEGGGEMIVIGAAKAKAKCKSCGDPAQTSFSFQVPGGGQRTKVDLCGRCRRLLGSMLPDDPGADGLEPKKVS